MKTYDVLVVGSGTAGQTAAHKLRAHGFEVALADKIMGSGLRMTLII